MTRYKNLVDTTEVSTYMMIHALDELVGRLVVNRQFDIPYLAGYSMDKKTIYIDRRLPRFFTDSHGVNHKVAPFLLVHEAVEKALIDSYGLYYQHAHQFALRTEMAMVGAANLNWKEYDAFMQEWIVKVSDINAVQRVPVDLDLSPYIDEGEMNLVQVMRQAMTR